MESALDQPIVKPSQLPDAVPDTILDFSIPLPMKVAAVIQNAQAYLDGWSYGKAGQFYKTSLHTC